MKLLINNALKYCEEYFNQSCCGHDFEHVLRVYKNAEFLISEEQEKIDETTTLLAAILHDVDDKKLVSTEESDSYKNTLDFLNSQNLEKAQKEKIINIISTVSYTEYLKGNLPQSLEAKIVYDADKLDQIGAVAISRAFAYGATHGRKIWDKNEMPSKHFQGKYPGGYASSLNYIIEVLLGIKSTLYTKTAKRIAQKRHEFMVNYLNEFFDENLNEEWKTYLV